MTRDRLAIDDRDRHGRYSIGWFLADDGDFGQMLGDKRYTEAQLQRMTDRTERECATAYLTALKTDGASLERDRIWWESRSHAAKALRAIKSAVANVETPWPEWAVKARAEGWTPPKGWKP